MIIIETTITTYSVHESWAWIYMDSSSVATCDLSWDGSKAEGDFRCGGQCRIIWNLTYSHIWQLIFFLIWDLSWNICI